MTDTKQKKNGLALHLNFFLLLGTLVAVEVLAALVAFETLSEITSLFFLLLISLNIIPIVLHLAGFRVVATILAFGFALAFVPWQTHLGHKLFLLKEESANVVNYVYHQHAVFGEYPADLENYEYQNPSLRDQIYFRSRGEGGFSVGYWVGTPTTSHFYNHEYGPVWRYHPD